MNKLINRNTGQIVVYGEGIVDLKSLGCKNVAEMLEAGWEDYKEPQVGYLIDPMEEDCVSADDNGYEEADIERAKELGLWFETKEEAEKGVEKLKAWKRLKDAGCKIVGWDYSDNVDLNGCKFNDDDFIIGLSAGDIDEEDLDLLFGGEDEN